MYSIIHRIMFEWVGSFNRKSPGYAKETLWSTIGEVKLDKYEIRHLYVEIKKSYMYI